MAAAFRVVKRFFLHNQTIEPTQVAGFNQFFDEMNGTYFWRYGFALDQKITKNLFGGAEYSWRRITTSYVDLSGINEYADWKENLFRAYLNWAPHSLLALSAEYQYERLDRDVADPGLEMISKLITQRVPLAANVFHPSGIYAQLKGTYVWQDGHFFNQDLHPIIIEYVFGKDSFWVFDAFLGYRLPNRWGAITVGVKNMFDEKFHFQDTDPANPNITPERFVYTRLTLNF